MPWRPRQLTQQVATRLARLAPWAPRDPEQPHPTTSEEDAQRLHELRTRAAALGHDLLGEPAPAYPPNLENILRLEMAYSERHQPQERGTRHRPHAAGKGHDATTVA